MKLEAGKYYRTRGGRKAYVAAVGCPFCGPDTCSTALGWIEEKSLSTDWSEDGKYSPIEDRSEDLISEWVEPKKVRVRGWINVYANSDYSSISSSREAADRNADPYRIACIEIDREVEEGEGLTL